MIDRPEPANRADMIARTPGCEKAFGKSYSITETRDRTFMLLVYGEPRCSGNLLSILEMEPDEVLDLVKRLEKAIE